MSAFFVYDYKTQTLSALYKLLDTFFFYLKCFCLFTTEFGAPTITKVELVDSTNLRVNWTVAGHSVSSYVLEILRYKDNRLRENQTVTVNQTFYVLKNANLNSEYRFRVQAISDTGNSNFTQQRVILLKPEGVGLRVWHIALIVIFLLLAVLLCCILCCCIVIFWKERRRTYYAEKQGLCLTMYTVYEAVN